MLEPSILMAVEKYIAAVKDAGIHVEFVVVFGSHATGCNQEWSDVDLPN